MATRRAFGNVRKLPSGAFQARYTGPDGREYKAPRTFQTKGDADTWLSGPRSDIERDRWVAPGTRNARLLTVAEYAKTWLAGRDLKPTTRAHYQLLLDTRIIPALGDHALATLAPIDVRAWYATLDKKTPTIRAHTYALLRTIYTTAVADDLLAANPCRIRGAGASKRARAIQPATLAELTVITDAMPARLKLIVLLAAWCALRFGELTELRRSDIDLRKGRVRVRRGVTRAYNLVVIGTPKSDAGIRDVAIPPHLLPLVTEHLKLYVGPGKDALLFPATGGGNMSPTSLYWHFFPAREAAGRPDLRFHDLRHTGAVLAAATGATLAELMARLGHSTPSAAMVYQHASVDRDRVIADALSKLAAGGTA
ncbi:MAG: tyrosine-type recombinase/integrase [Cellulomonas sp.]